MDSKGVIALLIVSGFDIQRSSALVGKHLIAMTLRQPQQTKSRDGGTITGESGAIIAGRYYNFFGLTSIPVFRV